MKINGVKHLNSNLYDYIMIRNLDYDEIRIDIKNDIKINTIKNKDNFYNKIKELDEKEKIKEIIRYYLRNNKIYSIIEKGTIKHYDGDFIIIEGTRNLYLQLKENTLDKEILNEIISKYIKDRYEYVYNNTFNKIEITYSYRESSCYIEKYINDIEDVLNITLKDNNKKLLNFEEEFIINYIDYLFKNSDKKIYFRPIGISVYMYKHYNDLKFGEFPGFYFYNDDFTIKVNNNLFSDIYYLMDTHNKNLENVKKLQLSFDGLQKNKIKNKIILEGE